MGELRWERGAGEDRAVVIQVLLGLIELSAIGSKFGFLSKPNETSWYYTEENSWVRTTEITTASPALQLRSKPS